MPVFAVLLEQDPVDGQEITKDPDPPFRGRAVPGYGSNVARALPNGPKEIQLDGGLQRGRALMRLQHFEYEVRSQRTRAGRMMIHGGLSRKLAEASSRLQPSAVLGKTHATFFSTSSTRGA